MVDGSQKESGAGSRKQEAGEAQLGGRMRRDLQLATATVIVSFEHSLSH